MLFIRVCFVCFMFKMFCFIVRVLCYQQWLNVCFIVRVLCYVFVFVLCVLQRLKCVVLLFEPCVIYSCLFWCVHHCLDVLCYCSRVVFFIRICFVCVPMLQNVLLYGSCSVCFLVLFVLCVFHNLFGLPASFLHFYWCGG